MTTLTVFLAAIVYVAISIPVTLWICPRLFRYSSEDKCE